jgi:hypothetical protein
VPVGPVGLIGSVADWRTVLEREKKDGRDNYQPAPGGRRDAYEGERRNFPMLESD